MASPGRQASLLSYFAISCLGGIVLMFVLEVPRAPLPRDDIASLAASLGNNSEVVWPRPRISISASIDTLPKSRLQEFAAHLSSALARQGTDAAVEASELIPVLQDIPLCLAEDGDSELNQKCLTAIEGYAEATRNADVLDAVAVFRIVVVPSKTCSALFLDAGTSALLRWSHGEDPKNMADTVAEKLQATWFMALALSSTSPIFEISPSYVISFFLVSDCHRRAAWDFPGSVLMPYLRRFLGRLRTLFDMEMDSQVVQCSALGGSADSSREAHEVDVEALKADFLQNANEWPGDIVTKDSRWLPPLLRLAAFWPSKTLHVLDESRKRQRAFAVPGWGAVALVGAGSDEQACNVTHVDKACSLTLADSDDTTAHCRVSKWLPPCEAREAASSWVSIVRSWLTLHPEGPSGDASTSCNKLSLYAARPQLDGITTWEQLLVAKIVHRMFIQRAAETLQNVVELVDSMPDLEIRPEIGDMVGEAAASARRSILKAEEGKLVEALQAARHALQLSLTASHDDTVVATLYFSWQFKWAVYLPLLLPILVPTLVAIFRDVKKGWKLRKQKNTAQVEEEEVH